MINTDVNGLSLEVSDEWKLAYDYLLYTGCNIFLTGRAGTGKTTFLHTLKTSLPKRHVVVAPTGVAAINAGGVTIHSFFQLPFGPLVPGIDRSDPTNPSHKRSETGVNNRLRKDKINIIRSIDLLVIDEVSMVRADLLDAIDGVLRQYRKDKRPFGGVQLLMIGDLQQLAPVIKSEEWNLLKEYYDTGFFFGSRALQRSAYITIELTKVFRQKDHEFISLLNKIRDDKVDAITIDQLNNRYSEHFAPLEEEGYITLTTHNQQAKELNDKKLEEIKSEESIFRATIEGDFPEQLFPTEADLVLKKGAQVMFVKNDPSPGKEFFNGKIGTVEEIDEDTLVVRCEGEETTITVTPLEWKNVRYSIDRETKEITEEIIGSFTQIPLKTAWAITIHKSQGLTFDKVIIDANAAFAHGQVYVALSRCRTLDGLVLSSRIIRNGIISDGHVREFQDKAVSSKPGHKELEEARKEYHDSLLLGLFGFGELGYILGRLKKKIEENATALTGEPVKECEAIEKRFIDEIMKVAKKFSAQLDLLLKKPDSPETSMYIVERVTAAANYFKEKIETILVAPIADPSWETDNKEVARILKEESERLLEEANMKLACLGECDQGFDIHRHLRAKALATISPVKIRKVKKYEVETVAGETDQKLVHALKKWRNAKADEANVAPYMIISVKAIEQLAAKKPDDKKELLKVKGIGKKKAESFGPEIIEIIGNHKQTLL
jgi:hypothetical protein